MSYDEPSVHDSPIYGEGYDAGYDAGYCEGRSGGFAEGIDEALFWLEERGVDDAILAEFVAWAEGW